MEHLEAYRTYFTKDHLMGPNSFRLLEELIRRGPEDVLFDRTLDLGCGKALTSVYLARETKARQVFAYDLWISATENAERIRTCQLEDRIIPIHGDAMELPFAHEYFDCIVSVDAYHYFGCREGVFSERILPFVRRNGYVMIAVPGLKEEAQGPMKTLLTTWAEGDDATCFNTMTWWEEMLKKECGDRCEITLLEAACFEEAWKDWFHSGHEYAVRDRAFFEQGLDQLLNFILIYVKRKDGSCFS